MFVDNLCEVVYYTLRICVQSIFLYSVYMSYFFKYWYLSCYLGDLQIYQYLKAFVGTHGKKILWIWNIQSSIELFLYKMYCVTRPCPEFLDKENYMTHSTSLDNDLYTDFVRTINQSLIFEKESKFMNKSKYLLKVML